MLVSYKLLFLVPKIHRSHAVKQQTLVMFILMQSTGKKKATHDE